MTFSWEDRPVLLADTRALPIYGYPIGALHVQDGRTVQYFERAIFEMHPEHHGMPYEVQLALLGNHWLRNGTIKLLRR